MAEHTIGNLPCAGHVYSFPVGDGRLSVCRIIHDSTSEKARRWGGNCVLAAASSWLGNLVPSIDDPELRTVLRLTHHSWDGDPNVLWVMSPVPPEFQLVGHLEPSADDKAIDSTSLAGNWSVLTQHALIQWRWDHDRSALLRDDAASDAREAERRHRDEERRRAYLESVRLEDLAERCFFPTWEMSSERFVEASRAIMRQTVEGLIELGLSAPKKAKMEVLKGCIKSFNRLDRQSRHAIDTVEREDICEEFDAIVHACGLGVYQNLADRWRDW